MPGPSKEAIEPDVHKAIGKISGHTAEEVKERDHLRNKLGFTVERLKQLAGPFQDIARKTNPAAEITRSACSKLKTARAAVTLVHEKAQPK